MCAFFLSMIASRPNLTSFLQNCYFQVCFEDTHDKMGTKLSEIKWPKYRSWPTISTYFPRTDSGITEMGEFGPIEHSYAIYYSHVNFCDLQEN